MPPGGNEQNWASLVSYVDKNSKQSILKFHQILLDIAEVIAKFGFAYNFGTQCRLYTQSKNALNSHNKFFQRFVDCTARTI